MTEQTTTTTKTVESTPPATKQKVEVTETPTQRVVTTEVNRPPTNDTTVDTTPKP